MEWNRSIETARFYSSLTRSFVDFRVRYTRVCKESPFRATIFLHDDSVINYRFTSKSDPSYKNIQKFTVTSHRTIVCFKNLSANYFNYRRYKFIFYIIPFIHLQTSKILCIVHFIPIPPISSNTEIEISQFAGPRNSFEIKYLSLSAARTSRRGEGSIRANRSKVRHLNNLFLVLPFPSVPRLLHAREPAGRLARRNFNGGTQAAPHGSSVL